MNAAPGLGMTRRCLLNTKQAAAYLSVHSNTLANWRSTKAQIIPWLRIGKKIYYQQKDLDDWIDHQIQK